MKYYILKKSGINADEDTLLSLVDQLNEIDPQQCRPPYAMFLVDAYIENREGILTWDINKLNEYIYIREQKRIAGIIGVKDTENDCVVAALWLITYASMIDSSVYPDAIPQYLQRQLNILNSMFSYSNQRFLQVLESISPGSGVGTTAPIKPDIIGEFLVIRQIEKYRHNIDIRTLIKDIWEKKPHHFSQYLSYLVKDFQNYLRTNLDLVNVLFTIPENCSFDTAISYIAFLCNSIYYNNQDELLMFFKDKLYLIIDNEKENTLLKMAISAALVNLILKQNSKEAYISLSYLEKYYRESNETDFAVFYARGLITLSSKREEPVVIDTKKKLEELYERHSDNQVIINCYAGSIMNLLNYEVHDECINSLGDLYRNNPNDTDVQITYAKGIINLMPRLDKQMAEKFVKDLEALLNNNINNLAIAFLLFSGILNLYFKYPYGLSQEMEDLLANLIEKYAFTKEELETKSVSVTQINLPNSGVFTFSYYTH